MDKWWEDKYTWSNVRTRVKSSITNRVNYVVILIFRTVWPGPGKGTVRSGPRVRQSVDRTSEPVHVFLDQSYSGLTGPKKYMIDTR
jgi:hypothetical protein